MVATLLVWNYGKCVFKAYLYAYSMYNSFLYLKLAFLWIIKGLCDR